MTSTKQPDWANKICADELLAHLRESGICELLEMGQKMRDAYGDPESAYPAYHFASRWDAAKAKLLAKGDDNAKSRG